ncbi:rho guanine nucleotide exchange factor 12-like [Ciona intestinalis]
MNLDTVEQHWSKSVSSDVLRSIDRKETKRQEVINELIFTEQHHLRDLKILEKLFYEPMKTHNLLNDDELYQAFPNLSEVVRLHRELNRSLQEVKTKEGSVVGDLGGLLLKRFDGDAGNTFKEESAHYCGNQSTVLAFVKERVKKDQKFANFIQGAQRHPICRKLHLKDFVPMEFQRLTKYPLLLENIIKNTKKKQETELNNLKRACDRCREILAFVNQTVKVAEDKQQILEINNNLDRSSFVKNTNPVIQEYKNIDLTQHPVVHHGPLTLRVGQMDKRKEIFVHCILYEELLVLLQKQDDRFVLKSLSAGQDKSYAPFLKMGKLIIRNVATDKRAFFVMSLEKEAFMYEFATASTSVVKQWMVVLSDTSARWKETPNKTSHRREAFLVPGTSKDIPDYDGIKEAGELIGRREENLPQVPILELSVMPEDDNDEQHPVVADDNDLIASRAPPTLYEQIKIKQREISEAFATKRRLLAMYAGAGEGDLEGMMELLHLDGNPQPQALVMDALLHVDKLTSLLNETSSPENSFTRSLTTTGHETGYQSDNPPDPQERWATPVTPNPPSPMMSSSATLNSISDIPPDIGQSETSVKSRTLVLAHA